MSQEDTCFFWFRRDLRLHDNHGLYKALIEKGNVQPVFIFDEHILDELPSNDIRVSYLHQELSHLKDSLQEIGADLLVLYGKPEEIWKEVVATHRITSLYYNHDYEPYARERDNTVGQYMEEHMVEVHHFKDHVIYENDEIKTGAGGIYTVFTPYKRKWLSHFEADYLNNGKQTVFPSEDYLMHLRQVEKSPMLSLETLGFEVVDFDFPSKDVARSTIKNYEANRNFPSLENGTSRLGLHFRFGTISIREKARKAHGLSDTYLSELIWRDFYAQILANFPHVVTQAFRAKYDAVPWRDAEEDFAKWCAGKTGYPLVDAGMRELNETGFMHNRVRMVTASFLTKHLLINWRKGEAYFALKLLDFDLASNNGGWQWASGSGTDAAPYFRVFNPTSQMEKFDKERKYIKRWVPEYGTENYPEPMVDHKFARTRCLDTYKAALANE